MWIVLLDRSASMADPFADSSGHPDRRTRRTDQDVKLDAAKESVLIELDRLPSDMPVVLLGFNRSVVEIMQGTARSGTDFAVALESLQAEDGTDIAAALRSAAEYAQSPADGGSVAVLLVSDGLSEPVAAREAALQCRDAGIVVDAILIDPTDDGVALIRRIAGITHGRWDAVRGRDELAASAAQSAEAAVAHAQEAEALLASAVAEADTVGREVADREPVSFTAAYPGLLEPGDSAPLWLYVHLSTMQAEVERELAEVAGNLGRLPGRATGVSTTVIPAGHVLEIRPVLDQFRCVPDRQDVIWLEQLEALRFDLTYVGSSADATCRGRIEVNINGLPVAEVPLVIQVTVPAARRELRQLSSAPMLRRVFASYAHEDEQFVRRCKAAYRALGINLFVDREDLESGQPWRSVLREMIAQHDLFQLYWSQSAAASTHVAEEWDFALKVATGRAAGQNFIRPLYWTRPMAAAPAALKDLHFRYVDPQSLGLTEVAQTTCEAVSTPGLPPHFDVVFPVLACTPDPSGSTLEAIRHALPSVVPFIERLTSLRYYPPPTLLVDDFTVSSIRRNTEADDGAGTEPPDAEDAKIVIELLESLALIFHTGGFLPDKWWGNPPAVDLKNEVDKVNFDHVRRNAEAAFIRGLRSTLAGADPATRAGKDLATMVAEVLNPHPNTTLAIWRLTREIKRLLQIASPDDAAQLRRAFGPELIAELDDCHGREWEENLASTAGSPEVLTIAGRYESELQHFFKEVATLPWNSFLAYAESFLGLMREFASRAIQLADDGVFENGYWVSGQSIRWVQRKFPETITETAEKKRGNDPAQPVLYSWSLTRSGYLRLLTDLSNRALRLLREPARNRPSLLKTSALTFGAYTHGGGQDTARIQQAASRNGVPDFAIPTAGPKVLICANAFDRLVASLMSDGLEHDAAHQHAEKFLLATLVHEHLHAALAIGLDENGQTSPSARNANEWRQARNLNESLAAWASLDFSRDDLGLFDACWEYIQRDTYPQWPYRGAERIEEMFQEQGPAALRSLIRLLREDPEVAQRRFDTALSASTV
ncbi:hypothetical protein ABB07_08965 [Streptomyces incarnatus]|uniref:VWFA domain-containing protein n=1 Tax=Streptomyces incarnatus TaxID=665007 RepID=A0ABM5TGP4_9ACTN|nr:TIR domain-containing protein [Streptomyces incarnatus]AKJ10148.1 hypothetical protein ABB07_08965 [Streptomyces incarnatus]